MFDVYRITNKINNKSYIGVSKRTQARFRQHFVDAINKKYNTYFYSAIRKYGREAFELSIVETFTTEKDVYEAEKKYIRELETLAPKGYNSHEGGRGGSLNATPELRKKLSDAKIGCIPWNKGKKFAKTSLPKPKKIKEYTITFLDGAQIVVNNMNAFCKANGYTFPNICKLRDGLLTRHKDIKSVTLNVY